jgi:hypothetical protein
MLGEEAIRLLREVWPTPTMLAEELFVLLSSPDIPITTSAPITYTPPNADATQAALNIATNPGQPAISITGPGGTSISLGTGGIDLGGVPLYNIGIPPANELPPFPEIPGTTTSGGSGTLVPGGGIPGTIVSGGPGANYVFQPTAGGATINVIQGQIDPSQTIPAGTFAIASLVGKSTYYIAVPVWL